MKLIASADFHNNKGLGIQLRDKEGKNAHLPRLDEDGAPLKNDKGEPQYHDNHIHKGAIFEIGTGDTFAEMIGQTEALAKIQQLAHCAVPMIAANAGHVARIPKEVAEEARKTKRDEARAKELAAATTTAADILKSLPTLIGSAVKAALAKN